MGAKITIPKSGRCLAHVALQYQLMS